MSGIEGSKEVLTIEEAAELLGVSVKTFNKVLHTENIPGTDMRLAPMQMVSGYFDTVLQTLLIFGVSFELPLILLFLGIIGLVDHRQLWRFGRYFILIAFTVGAIFSPPDVVSQTLVSVPLCLLYFLSIILVYFFGTKKPAPEVKIVKAKKKAGVKKAKEE